MRYMLVIVWPAHEGTPTLYLNLSRVELDAKLDYENKYIRQYGANYYIYTYNAYGNPYVISVNNPLTDTWQ